MQTVKAAPGVAVLGTMARVAQYSLAQLGTFKDRQVQCTEKEAELIRRQAEGMRRLADSWEQLINGA